jgi:NAD(P)-dependent dehydrogenase (short-subunit alcohol dehydrogenase family)
MPADLTGKRCIVTGGATGIGRASAIRIAELGAQVAILDNNEGGNDTSREINDGGGNSRFWSVDVRDEANVAGTVIAAKAWLEDIDILLHFAGVLHGASISLDRFDEKTWDTVVDINLRGTYLMAKYVVIEMLKKPGPHRGTIILAASGAGVKGGSSSYAYGASKGGVHGFTMVMQQYLEAQGIRVNDIAPGAVETPLKVAQLRSSGQITERPAAEVEDEVTNLTSPRDVAEVVAFMASDEANVLRGIVFTA